METGHVTPVPVATIAAGGRTPRLARRPRRDLSANERLEAALWLTQIWAIGALLFLPVLGSRGGVMNGWIWSSVLELGQGLEFVGLPLGVLLVWRGRGRTRLSGSAKCLWDLSLLAIALGSAGPRNGAAAAEDLLRSLPDACRYLFALAPCLFDAGSWKALLSLDWTPARAASFITIAALSVLLLTRVVGIRISLRSARKRA